MRDQAASARERIVARIRAGERFQCPLDEDEAEWAFVGRSGELEALRSERDRTFGSRPLAPRPRPSTFI